MDYTPFASSPFPPAHPVANPLDSLLLLLISGRYRFSNGPEKHLFFRLKLLLGVFSAQLQRLRLGLFLVVEMRLEFDQRLVFECGWKIVDVFLLRQLYETANNIPLGISWTVTFPTTVVELGSFSAANAVSEFVKAERRLEVSLRGFVKLWDAPEGLHSFGPNQLSLLHLQASQKLLATLRYACLVS